MNERPNVRARGPWTCRATCCAGTSSRHSGQRSVASIREPRVQAWRPALPESGVNAVTVAKAYRLLKEIFNTAVDNGLIRRNLSRTVGGG